MRQLIIISLPLLVCFAACIKPTPPDIKCELPQEPPMQFDLRNPEHRRHLSDEALLAEDIAVRYSDSDAWKVPGQPKGREAYRRARYDCMANLFNTIAQTDIGELQLVITSVAFAFNIGGDEMFVNL